MIRFIIKRRSYDSHVDMRTEAIYTVDAEAPELEAALSSGGFGNAGFEVHELMGVELMGSPTAQEKEAT